MPGGGLGLRFVDSRLMSELQEIWLCHVAGQEHDSGEWCHLYTEKPPGGGTRGFRELRGARAPVFQEPRTRRVGLGVAIDAPQVVGWELCRSRSFISEACRRRGRRGWTRRGCSSVGCVGRVWAALGLSLPRHTGECDARRVERRIAGLMSVGVDPRRPSPACIHPVADPCVPPAGRVLVTARL